MENINFENIIKSFFLGILIGVILQFYDHTDMPYAFKVMAVLASGSIGFIIGLITEWITAILPISLANARTYFFINNLIAVIVAALIMASLIVITSSTMENKESFLPIVWIVLGIICIANLFDYLMYRRAQKKLKTFKAWMNDK
ncbi:hypothetical protein [Paenibacillus paridis]|uniref:hypothetical protein n=1 Tax=Paenibacillus paridis TaxID=2583376 RepID=UPI00111DF1C0|nr:hypothetical protein [Paenibacillus paridis]